MGSSRRYLRFKVFAHGLLRSIRRAAAGCMRCLPGAWHYLHLPQYRIRSLHSWVRDQRETKLDWYERRSGPFIEQIQDSIIIKRAAPRSIGKSDLQQVLATERHHYYEPVYLAVLPRAHVFGPNGIVVTNDGGVIEQSTWGKGHLERDPTQLACKLPAAERLEGRYYTIADVGGGCGYYHWFADVLPRLISWECLLPDDMHLIVNTPIEGWKDESLRLLGMGDVPTVQLGNKHIQPELLYFPSYVGAPSPHPLGCRWLRQKLLHSNGPSAPCRRRLYISRSRAKSRRIVNEADLMPVLDRFGFEILHTEGITLREQIKTFSCAEAIIAAHGAGLTNMLWAPSSCKILEIFEPAYIQLMFYFFAEILAQEYWYLVGTSAGRPSIQHQATGWDDIVVDKDDLSKSLDSMLSRR